MEAADLEKALANLLAAGVPVELVQQYGALTEKLDTLHTALQDAVQSEDKSAAQVILQQMLADQEKLQALLLEMDASKAAEAPTDQ